MGRKRKEENEDSAITEMRELYENKLKEQEALKNLLQALEKNTPVQTEHPKSEGHKKTIKRKS